MEECKPKLVDSTLTIDTLPPLSRQTCTAVSEVNVILGGDSSGWRARQPEQSLDDAMADLRTNHLAVP